MPGRDLWRLRSTCATRWCSFSADNMQVSLRVQDTPDHDAAVCVQFKNTGGIVDVSMGGPTSPPQKWLYAPLASTMKARSTILAHQEDDSVADIELKYCFIFLLRRSWWLGGRVWGYPRGCTRPRCPRCTCGRCPRALWAGWGSAPSRIRITRYHTYDG